MIQLMQGVSSSLSSCSKSFASKYLNSTQRGLIESPLPTDSFLLQGRMVFAALPEKTVGNIEALFSDANLSAYPLRTESEKKDFEKRVALLRDPEVTQIKGTLNIGGQKVSEQAIRDMMVKALSYSYVSERINYFENPDSRDFWGSCAIMRAKRNGKTVYRMIASPNYYIRQPLSEKNKAHCAELESIKKAQRIADEESLENPEIIFMMNVNRELETFPKKNLSREYYDVTPCGTCQDDFANLLYKHMLQKKSDDKGYKNTISMCPQATLAFVRRNKKGTKKITEKTPMVLNLIPIETFYGGLNKQGIPVKKTSIINTESATVPEKLRVDPTPGAVLALQRLETSLTGIKEEYRIAGHRKDKTKSLYRYLVEDELPKTMADARRKYEALKNSGPSDKRTLDRISFQIAIQKYEPYLNTGASEDSDTRPWLFVQPTLMPDYAPKSRIDSMSAMMAGMVPQLKYLDNRSMKSLLFTLQKTDQLSKGRSKTFIQAIDHANQVLQRSEPKMIPIIGFYTPGHAYGAHEIEVITNKQAGVRAEDMLLATIQQQNGENVIRLETVAEVYPYLYISAGNKDKEKKAVVAG